MEDMYAFMEQYLEEDFEVESVLKESPRGTVTKLRQRASHRRYICRRYLEKAEIYFHLLGKQCPYLPRVYEAAVENGRPDGRGGRRSTAGQNIGTGQSSGRMIVLEEYVAGDTLSMLLQGGTLSEKETRKICLQLCKALSVLHSLGWVHRDIKPENVVILGDRAVLIDYDAARTFEADKDHDTRILGTVGYAPPEQYGISETDYRADIYAMGVLMNEMLTGQHPSRTLAKGKWGRIISRCTMIQPDKRYSSVIDLMEAM